MTEARHAVGAGGQLVAAPRRAAAHARPPSRRTDATRRVRGDSDSNRRPRLAHRPARRRPQGDNVAFADVYRDTQPRLYRYAVTLVGREAEDVTAEAWLQISRDLRGFTGDAQAFRGWAATVVRNRAIDQLRSAARRPVVLVETADLDRRPTPTPRPARPKRSRRRPRSSSIATLPRDQAEAVLLRAVVGLDAATAGKVLGKRPGAVRVAAHRGLRTPRSAAWTSDDAVTRPTIRTALTK